ncbi:flagellar hook assembly protein FlgD [Methylovorus glucosotrophus]|uniref:Basal-body rod modification protein FlgD n=1 Tax=Methylovorus glucosotrophus (strain SIP3-4) TaxID=582744 RepID=C6XBV0_METGS|nr:flagellar hook assembly protein FlgD [Methylovorus glucosotrophus]ACT50025.1 flagellar hook capping protein [Methylovorus glucosotrophus SIP3-4]KAF0844631.1 flagellar basal-body rod modification protein FlgD [Methylovorus glucosotrophus]
MTTISNDLLTTMNTRKSGSGSTAADAQDRFMTLLITQMKSQDPLNPMDNAQVTSQLAQLSTVTGIDKLNSTMESMISNVQSSQTYQASNMIGRYVLTKGDSLTLTESKSYLGINLPVGADKVTVTIKDSAGNQMRQLTLGKQEAGVLPLSWDGYKDDGSKAADGNYKFEVTATTANTSVTATPLSYDQVMSVSNSSSGIKLNLGKLDSIGIDDVVEVF